MKRDDIFCRSISELLISYSQNSLSVEEATTVDRHLENCRICRNELVLLKELQQLEQSKGIEMIDPASIIEQLDPVKLDKNKTVPTVNAVINDIVSHESDNTLSRYDKTKRSVEIIYRFLLQIRSFLKGQYSALNGNDWIKLEKRRAALLRKVLNHKYVSHLKPVMQLQAAACVSRGIIFQLHGNTVDAETNLGLSVVVHWALNSFNGLEAHRFLGEFKFYQGDLDSAEFLFAKALQSTESNYREHNLLLRNLGNVFYVRGNLSASRQYLEQAIAVSNRLELPDYAAQDLLNLSVIDFHQGYPEQAAAHCEKALAIMTNSANAHLKGSLHSNLATFMTAQGLYKNARIHYQNALQFFQKGHFNQEAVQVIRNNALAEYECGSVLKALDIINDAIDMYPEQDALKCQMFILAGRIERQKGNSEKARQLVNQAIYTATEINEHLLLDAAQLENAFIALKENKLEDVKQILAKTSAIKKKRAIASQSIFDLENESALVEAFAAIGNHAAAARCIRRLKRMLQQYKKLHRNRACYNPNAFNQTWNLVTKRLQQLVLS